MNDLGTSKLLNDIDNFKEAINILNKLDYFYHDFQDHTLGRKFRKDMKNFTIEIILDHYRGFNFAGDIYIKEAQRSHRVLIDKNQIKEMENKLIKLYGSL